MPRHSREGRTLLKVLLRLTLDAIATTAMEAVKDSNIDATAVEVEV